MRIQEPQRAALHLASGVGFGAQSFQALWRAGCADALSMLDLPDERARSLLKPKPFQAWQAARQAFRSRRDQGLEGTQRLLDMGVLLAVRGEPAYPAALRDLDGAPILVFLSGPPVLEALARPCAAVVGTREASAAGLETARHLAAGLAQQGVTVVSGAAPGIDAAAHQGAADAGGLTVAVLGTPLGVADTNLDTRRLVSQHGGCVSEYLPGAETHAGTFPQRNRIITGLSGVVIVVEGAATSGAGITARFAQEQGRPLLAVPGDLRHPNAVLPNTLLKQGARAITEVGDALAVLGLEPAPAGVPQIPAAAPAALDPVLARVLDSLRPGQPRAVDDVVQECGLSAAEASRGLLELELLGLCRRGPGGAYARNG